MARAQWERRQGKANQRRGPPEERPGEQASVADGRQLGCFSEGVG